MKARVYDTTGKEVEQIELPPIFETPFRPDVIRRAVLASLSARRQPYGPDPDAGKRTSAENWGVGRGVARLPRVKGSHHHRGGKAAFVGIVVGGSVTHPPRPRSFREKINKKERLLAIRSAIAATSDPLLVESRGHLTADLPNIPLVVTSDHEELQTTKDIVAAFSRIGLIHTPKNVETENPVAFGDIDKANRRIKSIRAGKGKRRGRRHKNAHSVLFVTGANQNAPIRKAARNLAGVDVCPAHLLNAELLAPGTHPGRLTIWSKAAIEQLQEQKLFQ
jgi:large subunit ribosomal protein L4e